jgi:hypothetical protein
MMTQKEILRQILANEDPRYIEHCIRIQKMIGPFFRGATYRFKDGADPGDAGADTGADDAETATTDTSTSEGATDDGKKKKPLLNTPVALVTSDGKFIENWRESLPEDLRDEDCWKSVTDFQNMAKQFVNQRKAIGKSKVAIPTEKSSQEEWDAFYATLGRPEKPEDYQVEVPDDLKEVYTDEALAEAKKFAHSIGVTDKQFAAYMKFSMERDAKLLADQDAFEAQQQEEARQAAEKAMRDDFGPAYDKYLHAANRIVAEAFPKEEDQLALTEELGNNPRFIRFAAIVGSRLLESKAQVAQLTTDTPGDAMKKIKELQSTPGYMSSDGSYMDGSVRKFMSRDQQKEITERIRELYKTAYPNQSPNTFVGMGR